MKYFPGEIEKKWQERWQKERMYEPDLARARRPFYNLMMFPYPSAEGLHIGGMRTFTGVDIYGRFKRMQGHDVFEPIGLDGFGIHSENYALKVGLHPFEHAKRSQENFYRQLAAMGNAFAWDEHLETYDPEYYRWTQWIFTALFKRGLAYRKKQAVNWCPSCKTVLADEQVIAGACERCGTKVIKKDLEQWFFKITEYAERLLKNLESIEWSERVVIAQKNWIGRSEGALIKFPLVGVPGQEDGKHAVDVFTTRPDTLFGATFVVVSPERAKKWMDVGWSAPEAVKKYVLEALTKNDEDRIAEGRDKTGVDAGIFAVNPANQEKMPVWIADYVLGSVGTGAIMAVPAHDERDFAFAKTFGLPVVHVVAPTFGERQGDEVRKRAVISAVRDPKTDRVIVLNWGPRKERHGGYMLIGGTMHDGEDPETAARREIAEETGYTDLKLVGMSDVPGFGYFYSNTKNHNVFVEATGLYFELASDTQSAKNLDDGEHGKFTVEWSPVERVASLLDDGIHEYFFRELLLGESYTGDGVMINSGEFNGLASDEAKWKITEFVKGKRQVNYRLRDWLVSRQRYWGPPIPMIFCDSCATAKKGERDDMPGWYAVPEKDLPVKLPYVENFRPTGTDKAPLAAVEEFYVVACPACRKAARRETDVSDAFLDSAWYYLRYPSAKEGTRPWDPDITKRWLPVHSYIGGAEHSVLHLLYSRFLAMVFHDWGMLHFEEPFATFRAHGLITKDGAKMSKSKGNVINPDDYINAYGADAMRMYLAFLAPLTQDGDFRDSGIKGITRFLERAWDFALAHGTKIPAVSDPAIERAVHSTVKKVGEDIEALRYNTAISALMILLNEFEKRSDAVGREHTAVFLKLLAPFAPHFTEELWHKANGEEAASIHVEAWPAFDEAMLEEDTFELVVQVNGKIRGRIRMQKGATEDDAREAALKDKHIAEYLGAAAKKTIFVKDRLINFVLA